MYKASYSEVAAEDPRQARDQEGKAFDRIIAMLRMGAAAGRASDAERDALDFHGRLWTVLLHDLAHPDNSLPDGLRARLVSIGLRVLSEAEAIRHDMSKTLDGLIEINSTVREGLR